MITKEKVSSDKTMLKVRPDIPKNFKEYRTDGGAILDLGIRVAPISPLFLDRTSTSFY
jgi:hypothetical protein